MFTYTRKRATLTIKHLIRNHTHALPFFVPIEIPLGKLKLVSHRSPVSSNLSQIGGHCEKSAGSLVSNDKKKPRIQHQDLCVLLSPLLRHRISGGDPHSLYRPYILLFIYNCHCLTLFTLYTMPKSRNRQQSLPPCHHCSSTLYVRSVRSTYHTNTHCVLMPYAGGKCAMCLMTMMMVESKSMSRPVSLLLKAR